MDNTKIADKKSFTDANKLDKKIPQELLMKYQSKWYILKAGLEWKAASLFGGGNYGVTVEIIEKSTEYALAKATMTLPSGRVFSNYGEASKLNVTNPMMHKQLLHLAVTRAECRVLRMATACGYMSYDEMDFGNGNGTKELPSSENDSKPATAAQIDLLKKNNIEVMEGMTFRQAAEAIAKL
jgi:hypothetical protein